jgi:hypothetical protein
MAEWTAGATERLDRWLDAMVASVPPDTDAAEVREDLRAHVMMDLENARVALVTEEDVRRVTARLGSPSEAPPPARPPQPPSRAERPGPAARAAAEGGAKRNTTFVFMGGVLLPLAALLVELQGHVWAGHYLDPIPTPWHIAAIAAVAAVNVAFLGFSQATLARRGALFAALNGFAIGVPLLYGIVFLPSLPLAVFGLIFLLGMLPLSPYLAFFAALRARRWIPGRPARIAGVPPALAGILVAFLVLLGPEIHGIVTASLISRAASSDPEESLSAVRMLRRFGDERTMAAAARGEQRSAGVRGLLPAGIFVRKQTGPEAAAQVWYRVTGEPVPETSGSRTFFRGFEEGGRDDRQEVTLTASRLDGVVDAPGSNVYLQWTLTFRNDLPGWGEMRTDLVLPPGGVVSRATLWVDGEEREAAFAGRRQVTEAYERVVSYRKDPLLVTANGNERVQLRGYPVARDKDFQIRIGMTAPLVLESHGRGRIVLPRLAGRNFEVGSGVRHSVWIESPTALREGSAFAIDERAGRGWTARAQIDDDDVGIEAATLAVERPAADLVVAKDQLTPFDKTVVLQKISDAAPRKPSRVVLVVDGGRAMKDHVAGVADAIAAIPDGFEIGLIWAGEEVVDLCGGCRPSTRHAVKELSEKLSGQEAVGGTDGVAALARGFELASESPQGAVVWVHAGVARTLRPPAELLQAVERRPDDPKLYDFALTTGADEVAKAIPSQRIQRVNRLGDVASDFARLIGWWSGAVPKLVYHRERVAMDAVPAAAVEASAHVGRLWANERINRISHPAKGDLHEAVALAQTFQLVTPVSGAVVLETAEQYRQAGLQPVDPSTTPEVSVPSVPEPHEWALLAVAAAALLFLLLKRRASPRFA